VTAGWESPQRYPRDPPGQIAPADLHAHVTGRPPTAFVDLASRVDVLSGGGLPPGLFPDAEPERESLEVGQDDRRDDMTILVAKVTSPPA
jgi:hypothetical protein